MKKKNRKSISEYLKVFYPVAGEHSFIEVTEWSNGEGWDIAIDEKHISLHYSELDAINYLIKTLEYGIKREN